MSSAIKNILCKSCLIIGLGLTFLLAGHAQAQQQIVELRVDGDNGLPAGDGLTWATAFQFLQDALTRAEELVQDPNTTVHLWVAATVPSNPYPPDRDAANPNGTGDPEATFLLDFNNVQLLGGFAGNETDPNDRDPAVNITVLGGVFGGPCGDPDAGDCFVANNTPGCDDLCGGQPCPGCCQIVCDIDPLCCPELGLWDQTCASIAMGACTPLNPVGAGPQIYHVVTADGVDDTVRIDGFSVIGGFANGGVGNDRGAGMFIVDASPAVIRVTFTENSAPFHGGGAMHIEGASDPLVVNTSFIGNTGGEAGALHTETGAAGGTFVNCLFIGNSSLVQGGAINPGGGETLTFINCTFADNTVNSPVPGGGGAIFTETGAGLVNLINCILWGNLAGGDPNQIVDDAEVVIVTYSDVEGGWGVPMDMNIDEDPLFVDAGSGDYRLLIGSPCIDEGNNDDVPCDQFDLDNDGFNCTSNPPEGTPDLDLINRVLDGDDNDTDIVDMGSYEFIHPNVCPCADICPWDLDGNCEVGVGDLLILLGTWGPCADCNDCPADFDDNCTVGVSDLLALLGNWFNCPCEEGTPPPSLAEELADACLTQDDWDEFVDVMTDPLSSQADKDRYNCWMTHYLEHCNKCTCTHIPMCPGPDPFS